MIMTRQYRKLALASVLLVSAVAIAFTVVRNICIESDYIYTRKSGSVSSLSFSADSSKLAVGGSFGFVSVYQVDTQSELALLDREGTTPLAIGFLKNADNLYVITVDRNHGIPHAYELLSWNWKSGNLTRECTVLDWGENGGFGVSPHKRMMVFLVGSDLSIYKITNENVQPSKMWRGTTLAAVTQSWDSVIRLDDKYNLSSIDTKTLREDRIGALNKSKHYVQLATAPGRVILGTAEGDIILWELRNGEQRYLEKGECDKDFVQRLQISKDGSLLVVLRKEAIHIWNLNHMTMVRSLDRRDRGGGATSVAVSPDNRVIAIGYCEPPAYRAVVRLWNIVDGDHEDKSEKGVRTIFRRREEFPEVMFLQ